MPALHTTQTTAVKSRTSGVKAVLRAVQTWAMRRRSRQSLARLDAHMLRDIGLDEVTARQECTKAFWQD